MSTKFTSKARIILLASGLVSGLAVAESLAQSECVKNAAETRQVCVQWSQGTDPIEGTDFTVDYVPEADPIVELLTADLEWVVYSEIISSGVADNIHLLTLDTSGSLDFEVTIAEGVHRGAADVGSINLTSFGWTGFSSIEGGWIQNLTGSLILQREGTSGGDISGTFQIGEDLSGDLEVPVISGQVFVYGEVSGDIDVTVKMDDGYMSLQELTSTGSVTIADMVNDSRIEMVFVDGTVVLENGVPSQQSLFMADFDGTLNLSDEGVVGGMTIGGGSGSIVNGGTILGTATLSNYAYSAEGWAGTATFASVGSTGKVRFIGTDVSGEVHISGDMDGLIQIIRAGSGGSLLAGAELTMGTFGDTAYLWVSEAVVGDIVVKGDFEEGGAMYIQETLKSVGATAAGRILIDGVLDGELTFGQETQGATLIRALGGIGSAGSITINDSRGNFNANGMIHIGSTSEETPLDDVTFDGSIMIKDTTGGADGDLNGTIKVVGCHASSADLDICICGTNNGTITIVQTDCTNQVGHDCVTGCP